MIQHLAKRLLAFAVLAFTATAAGAETLPAPTGAVVLTIAGNISETNADGTAQFDVPMLEALGAAEFSTATNWTEGKITFTGPSLRAVLDRVGAQGSTLRAMAINDYFADFPLDEAQQDGPILAYWMNGQEMSIRDKGPLWIIYPFDDNADFRNEEIFRRSVWQLDRLEIIE